MTRPQKIAVGVLAALGIVFIMLFVYIMVTILAAVIR